MQQKLPVLDMHLKRSMIDFRMHISNILCNGMNGLTNIDVCPGPNELKFIFTGLEF